MMVEQLGEKCSLMKRRIEKLSSLKGDDEMNFGSMDDYNQIVLTQNHKKLQDANKLLNFELNDLRIKLADAESDTKLLREKIGKLKRVRHSDHVIDHIESGEAIKSQHLIEQIEKLRANNKELAKDLKLHLDEKEDLVKSRNSYIQKAERLNERLNGLMKSEQFRETVADEFNSTNDLSTSRQDRFLDIDSILSENSFLKERLKCLEEDRKFNQEMLLKYKHALDKSSSNKKNFFEPLSSLTHKKAGRPGDQTNYLNQDIISTRQLQSFIASNNLDNLELNEATLTNLRKLVLALFESVSDKTAALSLARTNNKLLGKRINDLEAKLKEHESKERNQRVETFRMNRLDSGERTGDESESCRNERCRNESHKSESFKSERCKNESRRSESSSTDVVRDEESEINERNEIDEMDLRNVSANIRSEKNSLDLDSAGLIDLPYNLQKLVELELNKLQDDKCELK